MKRLVCISVIGLFILCSFLAASMPAHAQGKVIKLKFANFFPPVHKNSIVAEQWCKEVEKRTNGRVKVSYFPGATLVSVDQAYEAAVAGIVDIALFVPQYTAGRFPLTEVIQLPMGVKNALQGTKMINAWYQKFKPKEYDDVKIIWLVTAPPGLFLTKKPLGSINDLRGLKIRAPGDTGKIVSAMGAVPVSVPPTDLYDGLQRGVIDGVNMTPECLKGWKLADLIRGMQENPGIGHVDANGVVMNKQKWNSLPPDIQQIIDRINEEWIEKAGRTWDDIDKEGREYGISKGLKVFKIPPEEARISVEKMKPLLDAYVKRMKEKGLPGEESLKFCQDYLKSHP